MRLFRPATSRIASYGGRVSVPLKLGGARFRPSRNSFSPQSLTTLIVRWGTQCEGGFRRLCSGVGYVDARAFLRRARRFAERSP
jgi:hypothetical protein